MKPLEFGNWTTPVMALQRNLQKVGYGNFIPTGYFGIKTKQAVQSFQKDNGLTVNGIYGPQEDSKMKLAISNINREAIYRSAVAFLGSDASPHDLAPDELGCADSVSGVLFRALGSKCGIAWAVATSILERELANSHEWMLVQVPQRGDVLVSATGKGNGNLSNGHTGIWGDDGVIMSNNSTTGIFEKNYNTQSWKERYVGYGGFPMRTYRKL